MRFLVFLLFSWCPPGLATKSLASLGLIKAGSKLSAFQKYTDNVVARFLKSDSAALSPAQATAMQTVKEYLKAMIWGDEGVWEWHLKDLGTSSASDCYSKLENHHVSLFCKTTDGVEKCWCNLELGNLGRRDRWGSTTHKEASSVAANGTYYTHQHGSHALTDLSGHTQGGQSWKPIQTSDLRYDEEGDYAGDAVQVMVCADKGSDESRVECVSDDIKNSLGQPCNGNSDPSDLISDGKYCKNIAITDAVEGDRVGFVKAGSGEISEWSNHKEGLGLGDGVTQISSNQVWLGGDDVRCKDTVGAKLANMRELRKLAELSYRRMHVCHNEKGQEFWLAGSQKADRAVLKTPDRDWDSAASWRDADLPKADGGGPLASSEVIGGKHTWKLDGADAPPVKRVAGEGAGFCGLYRKYRQHHFTNSVDKLWGGRNSGDTPSSNGAAIGNLEINNEAYLHSFPSCARGKYINRMAGGSDRQGDSLSRPGEYSSRWTMKTGSGDNEVSAELHGDRRCVAWTATERTEMENGGPELGFPVIGYVDEKGDWQNPTHSEVIVPRTCQMYNDKWIDGYDGETEAREWIQCDTWFRDCAQELGDHTEDDNGKKKALGHWRGSVSVENSAQLNEAGIMDAAEGYTKSAGATSGWNWDSLTDTEKAQHRQKNLFYNATHSTYAGCTQRKPLRSPLLQSCSYTANYNSYPPRKSTQEDHRGFHEFMYLEDQFVKTPIVSVREDMETCLEEVRAWFDPMWTHYSLCRRGEEIGRDDFLCEQEVMEWEDAVCVYTGRQEELCRYFKTCLEEQGTACDERNIDIERRVASRKLDYESTQRIECLLDAVSYLDEGCVCYDLCDDAAKRETFYDPDSFSNGWTQDWEGMIRIDPDSGEVVADTDDAWDTAEARPLLNYTYTQGGSAVTTDFSSMTRYAVWFQTKGADFQRRVSKPTELLQGDGGLKVYQCANDDETEETCTHWIPTPAFDEALKGAACQKEYEAQKRAAIDRCMIDLVKCTDMNQDDSRWHSHDQTNRNGGFDGTKDWATVTQSLVPADREWVDGTLRQPCVEGWLEDKNVVTKDDAGDDVGSPPRSLGWMRSDFRFPKQFVRPSDGKVVTTKCEEKFGMYACVNADWEQAVVTDTDDKSPEENKQQVETQQAQLRADHPGNVKEWVVGGVKKTDSGLLTAALHDGEISKPSGWKATRSSSQVCEITQTASPAYANGETVSKGTGAFTEDTVEDVKQNDDGGMSCPSEDGKIHLDTGIWHIKPGCDKAPPCDYPATFCPWECPETNQCETFRVADHPLTQTCKDVDNGWCVTERNINPRFFWQVPGRKEHNTGKSCGTKNCDASFQHIYYAQKPGGSNSIQFGTSQCNQDADRPMSDHYVRDHPTNTARFHNSFTHKVCKEGAEDHTYWQGLQSQSMKVFGHSSTAASEDASRQECDPKRGGPSYGGADQGYAADLAQWLRYPDYVGKGEDTVLDTVKGGRHCFQTDPCPHKQAKVDKVPEQTELNDYAKALKAGTDVPATPPGVGAYEVDDNNDKVPGTLVPFHKVYPFVTCPPADEDGNVIPCNSGYFMQSENTAYTANVRPYNPAQEDDTYCA